MKLPELIRRWYAKEFGYFWLPCPICGEHFGGFEIGGHLDTKVYYDDEGNREGASGVCVCRDCADIAERQNERLRRLSVAPLQPKLTQNREP